jgi:hypothetical protein
MAKKSSRRIRKEPPAQPPQSLPSLAPAKVVLSSADLPRVENPGLPTYWVDTAYVAIREDPAIALIRFYTLLPGAAVESCRIQTPVSHLRQLVDVIAKHTGYYPTPPADTQ